VRKEIIGNCELYLGDCLQVLSSISMVDAVITDPPFSSGARTDAGKSIRGSMTRGKKWKDDWFSHDNMATHGFLTLMRLVGLEVMVKCKTGARAHWFIDWRMYPNLYGALESCGWVVKNLVVWDKKHFGMGSNYRNQHELIIYAEKGDSQFPTHATGNVIQFAREGNEHHPTEKPVGLIRKLLTASTLAGEVVLDPFMGSGTTGVACVKEGRRFVGIEIDERHFEEAYCRIEDAYRQGDMFQQPTSHSEDPTGEEPETVTSATA
jgi:site-specific DNA-methyltransferase (adenine-specific)